MERSQLNVASMQLSYSHAVMFKADRSDRDRDCLVRNLLLCGTVL